MPEVRIELFKVKNCNGNYRNSENSMQVQLPNFGRCKYRIQILDSEFRCTSIYSKKSAMKSQRRVEKKDKSEGGRKGGMEKNLRSGNFTSTCLGNQSDLDFCLDFTPCSDFIAAANNLWCSKLVPASQGKNYLDFFRLSQIVVKNLQFNEMSLDNRPGKSF